MFKVSSEQGLFAVSRHIHSAGHENTQPYMQIQSCEVDDPTASSTSSRRGDGGGRISRKRISPQGLNLIMKVDESERATHHQLGH